jgi:hypothetical protein
MLVEPLNTQPTLRNTGTPLELWGWIAIGGFILLTMAGTFGAAKIMNFLYPASAFAVSLFLYHRYPLLFHSFVWWLFFLTPLVRRIVDYRSSFVNPSPILLAPVLAMVVILPSFIKYFPRSGWDGTLPFAISGTAVGYGFLMGCINHVPINQLILGSLSWLSPILYGFFIFINWRRYPKYQKNFERTLLWGILVMGIYGIYQYLVLPEWDRLWMVNTELFTAGTPAPRGMRVWSTMNSGEPFSAVMGAGLILILNGRGPLFVSSSVAGYIAFLLTLIRSGWLGWAAGIFVLFTTSRPKFQFRLILSAVTLTSLVIPIALSNNFLDSISARISTFSDLENDVSANSRQSMYSEVDSALGNFLGGGIADLRLDSSIFSLLSELGWVGGIPYLFGLFGLLVTCLKTPKQLMNSSSNLMCAAAVTCLVRVPVNNALTTSSGMILWGCLAFFLAGSKYSYHQRLSHKSDDLLKQ